MRRALQTGCFVIALCVIAEACENGASETSSGPGGAAVSSQQASSSSSASGAGGGGGALSACDAACIKVESTCGLGPICSRIPYLDCMHPDSECVGDCALEADCAAIVSIWAPPADPALLECLEACLGFEFCMDCVRVACPAEVDACNAIPTCESYVQCSVACPDADCINGCARANPSPETTTLIECGMTHCSTACLSRRP